MYHKLSKWITILLILASLLTACTQSLSTPPTALPTPSPTTQPATEAPVSTLAPTDIPAPLSTFTPVPAPVGECSLTDHGQILALVQDGDHWVLDLANIQVLDAAGNFIPMPSYNGCNIIVQGQKDPDIHEGHIWVLRDVFSNHNYNLSYLEADSTFVCSNCSAWAFPVTWNMETWDASEGDPVAGMYLTDLRKNMQENANTRHDWPIIVHYTDGSSDTFAPGETAGIQTGPSCKGLTEPQRVRVTGITSQNYVGSLGESDCFSVAWVDNSTTPVVWQGAYDNFEFAQVEYWLMPAEFDQNLTNVWAAAHTPTP